MSHCMCFTQALAPVTARDCKKGVSLALIWWLAVRHGAADCQGDQNTVLAPPGAQAYRPHTHASENHTIRLTAHKASHHNHIQQLYRQAPTKSVLSAH